MPEMIIKYLEYCPPALVLIIYVFHMVKAFHASKKYEKVKNIKSYKISFLSEEVVYKKRGRKDRKVKTLKSKKKK